MPYIEREEYDHLVFMLKSIQNSIRSWVYQFCGGVLRSRLASRVPQMWVLAEYNLQMELRYLLRALCDLHHTLSEALHVALVQTFHDVV